MGGCRVARELWGLRCSASGHSAPVAAVCRENLVVVVPGRCRACIVLARQMELARSDTDAARAADAAKPSPASWPGPELEPGRQPPPLPGPELELGRQPPPLPGPKLELGRQPPPLPTPTSQPQAAAPKPPTDATHASTLARSRWATAGSSIPVVEANATAKSAAGSPAETTPLVLEGDVAGTPQPRASTATDKSRTCAESKFWDGVLWHNLSTLIPALLGLAPFMWPMEGEAQQCFIPSDDGDALNVTCAAVSKPVLVWYTFPVWLVLCACMLLEFFWFQLSALASGVRLYVSICIVAMVLLTYVLLELLGTDEILDTGYTAYGWQAFRVLSTAVCAWPFLAVGICLLWRHSYVVNRHPRHETKQDFGDVVSLARAAAVSRPRARGEAGAGAKAEVRAPAYLCVLVRAEASCCGLNCYHRDLSQYEKSVVYRSGIWSEPRQDLPVTLLTTSSDFEHDNRTQESEPTNTESAEEGHRVRLEKLQKKWLPRTKGWRQRAHMSPTTLASYRRSFTWMTIVFAGLIMNWVWLQLFVLLYMEHATTPTRIAIGGFVFNGSQAIFGGFVKTFANRADTERMWRGACHRAIVATTRDHQPFLVFSCVALILPVVLLHHQASSSRRKLREQKMWKRNMRKKNRRSQKHLFIVNG